MVDALEEPPRGAGKGGCLRRCGRHVAPERRCGASACARGVLIVPWPARGAWMAVARTASIPRSRREFPAALALIPMHAHLFDSESMSVLSEAAFANVLHVLLHVIYFAGRRHDL